MENRYPPAKMFTRLFGAPVATKSTLERSAFRLESNMSSCVERLFEQLSVSVGPWPIVLHGGRGSGPQSLERQLLETGARRRSSCSIQDESRSFECGLGRTGAPKSLVNIFAGGYRFSHEDPISSPAKSILSSITTSPRRATCASYGTERHSIYTVSWRSLPYAELVAKVDRALRLDWVREILGTATKWTNLREGYFHPIPYSVVAQAGVLRAGRQAVFRTPWAVSVSDMPSEAEPLPRSRSSPAPTIPPCSARSSETISKWR